MFIFFTALFILPMFLGLYYSFTKYSGLGEPVWIGLKNYVNLFNDKFLAKSITNTLQMTAVNLITVLPVSFFCAYLLRKTSRKNTIYKTVLFAPYVIPGAISGLIWYFIWEPGTGLLNSVLRAVGLESWTQQWIGGNTLTPLAVGIVCAWGGMGFYMVLWQLGMKNISPEVMEASLIDGCNKRQQISKIMLPLLRDTTTNIFIFVLTGGLKIYETVFVLTGGGPNHASESLVSYLYVATFQQGKYGYGMAIAAVEFVFALVVTGLSIIISRRKKLDM